MTHDDNAFAAFLAQAHANGPLPMAVAHPCSREALQGAIEAADHNIARPILVGPEYKIRRLADELELDLADLQIVDVPHSHAAAEKAVELVR